MMSYLELESVEAGRVVLVLVSVDRVQKAANQDVMREKKSQEVKLELQGCWGRTRCPTALENLLVTDKKEIIKRRRLHRGQANSKSMNKIGPQRSDASCGESTARV
jgi:hypothetical protein